MVTERTLLLDAEQETTSIAAYIRSSLKDHLKRRGLVIGLSGGIDSSVTAALAVKAIGKDRVFALEMPERDSSSDTLQLSSMVAESLGIHTLHIDITHILEAVGFYAAYQAAVQQVLPEYGDGWASKVVTSNILENQGFSLLSIVAEDPAGNVYRHRLPHSAYLAIVAATNFKQRIRKMLEYYHADRLNYAVLGTPNRLEYDQGFFVKLGDGAADLKPIAHLYKSQVYQLAEHLGIPAEIRLRPPTTDTYLLSQGQDEFFFSLPYQQMDLCLYGKNHRLAASEICDAVGLSAEQVEKVYADIETKRKTTRYLHLPPLLKESIGEIHCTL